MELASNYYPNLDQIGLDLNPTIDADQAGQIALEDTGQITDPNATVFGSELIIDASEGCRAQSGLADVCRRLVC